MGERTCRRAAALAAALCALSVGAAPATAAIKLCIETAAVVPENPSVVVSKTSLAGLRVAASTGAALPYKVRPLTDYYVWIDIEAGDGTGVQIGQPSPCARFRKLKVSRDFRVDRRAPVLTDVTPGKDVHWMTVRSPRTGWLRTEWAYSRAELEAGAGGVSIDEARSAQSLAVPDGRRLVYVRLSSLLPDGTVGGTWTGWIDSRRKTFGPLVGRTSSKAPPARACSQRRAWPVPDGRAIVDGFGQRRFRAIDRRGRILPTRVSPLADGTWELSPRTRAGTEYWIQELPASAGICHGPLRVTARRGELRPIQPDAATEITHYTGEPIELRLALRQPTLWWELEIEWALTEAALREGRAARRVYRGGPISLDFGADVAVDFPQLYLRITPRHADGTTGATWDGRVVRLDDGALRVEQLR